MRMVRITMLLLLFFVTTLYGTDFETQQDSYFGHVRTKIVWSGASGLSTGSANGFLGMKNGIAGDVELGKFGTVKIAFKHLHHLDADNWKDINHSKGKKVKLILQIDK